MDYLEAINDPLKYYFKEKIGNLYINKDVMKVFIEKGHKEKGQSVLMLNESFLKFSEIDALETSTPYKQPSRIIDRPSFKKKIRQRSSIVINDYENAKIKKKVNAIMLDKINNKIIKNKDASYLQTNFCAFMNNDDLVKLNLQTQTSVINSKLFARRQKSFIKGNFIRYIKFSSLKQFCKK